MAKRGFTTKHLSHTDKGQLFSDELLELYETVRDATYDERREVTVSKELQDFLLSQNIGQVARAFRGADKTTNVHDTAVSLMEQLVREEQRFSRGLSDDEIVSGFWEMVEGRNIPKPHLPRAEFLEQRRDKAARRAEKADEKARKAEGGFVAAEQERRDSQTSQGASL